MTRPLLLHHPASLDHDTEPHPEQPARMVAIETELARRGWLGWDREESPEVALEVLERVHPAAHVERVRDAAAAGRPIDLDTVVSPGSWAAALHAAGGAVALVDLLLSGSIPTGASLHRPPGHHAGRDRAMGFCLFSNAAVAAQHGLDAHGLERVLVLDWDVHHGNGTEEIFRASHEVLFASLHEWPLYPGTGAADYRGEGDGLGYTLNLPVPGGSGDDVWCSLVEHVVVPRALEYAPQLILVSAGYDAHAEDPLATCRVTDEGFATMAGSVRRLGAELGVPAGVVLEGGYALRALGRGVAETLSVMGASDPPSPPSLEEHPLATKARERRSGPSG